MKVIHVNSTAHDGGAARAAHRIHLGQRKIGIDSRMAVIHKKLDDPSVIAPLGMTGRVRAVLGGRAEAKILSRQRSANTVFHSLGLFGAGLARWLNASDADLVNLHWVAAATLSIGEIAAIRKPIVWTMHDMWPFSGAEHYEDIAGRPRANDGYTPASRAATDSGPDLDAWVFRRKRRAWGGKTFHLASPSRWLAERAKASLLFSRMPCRVISNGIDLDLYKPLDRREARRALNLPQDKRLVLFGAMASTTDRRKGFHLLVPALQALARDPDCGPRTELLVFGARAPKEPIDLGLPVHYLGQFGDDLAMALIYSAADVFVAPSLQDNLPNTLVEALACGTPCVAFEIGGMPDLVRDESCGALAPAGDVDALARAIAAVLARTGDRARAACRQSAEARFADTEVARQYRAYYQEILKQPLN
ncbi:glycosyltransferase family 4 protein [Dongia sp.]|uniref:glycosyltransferase family 4 protein n=1 Tax=Dongia sp. TaxID=1977262 RepID=UPI0037534D01